MLEEQGYFFKTNNESNVELAGSFCLAFSQQVPLGLTWAEAEEREKNIWLEQPKDGYLHGMGARIALPLRLLHSVAPLKVLHFL